MPTPVLQVWSVIALAPAPVGEVGTHEAHINGVYVFGVYPTLSHAIDAVLDDHSAHADTQQNINDLTITMVHEFAYKLTLRSYEYVIESCDIDL